MSVPEANRDLLLIAQAWQPRALVLAELQERGCEVTALPGVRYALNLLARRPHHPPLLVLDVHGDDFATPDTVAALLRLAPNAPVVLILGAYQAAEWEPLRSQAAAVLRRPVSVGEVVETVGRVLGSPGGAITAS